MAEPLKIIRRLDKVTTDYAVFEPDQVLTDGQLNSVVEYLDDQSRLTRTQLLGIGLVGGLRPVLAKGQISLSKGVGITSDGDLLGWSADSVFDKWLKYDEGAPVYGPFYTDGNMLPLFELLASDDRREGKPLAEFPEALEKMVVVAFMESYENDPDLCTGGNCDNRGRTAHNTQRLLLVSREIAEKIGLAAALPSGPDIARQLPRIAASRVELGSGAGDRVSINSAESFAAAYRRAASETLGALAGAVGEMIKAAGEGWPADLPSPAGWAARLKEVQGSAAGVQSGIQYYHAFAKDLVATWGELRAALFADKSVLCPAVSAFPKHLLLGALADTTQLRSAHYPAPWLVAGAEHQRVAGLLRKFDALLNSFELPKVTRPAPKIVPSRRETAPLEQRAVPIYYRSDSEVRTLWNEERRQRGESDDNPGYFWMPPADTNAPDDPFRRDLGNCDFFRIEGHLGINVDLAEPAIEKLIRQRNLPISVISVQLHNKRELVIRGPRFRKNSLHSLHYLLRQDLASHLKDNIAFSDHLVKGITAAGNWAVRPAGNALAAAPAETVAAAKLVLQNADDDLVGSGNRPLSARSYKAFSALKDDQWSARFDTAVLNTTKVKANLGDIMRTDVMSPVDVVSGSKSQLWVNWLGDILKKREDEQKDRLLFTNMISEHPGLEHLGGAVPGGTFVLAYDDQGVVIGDLMLPYWIDDSDDSDKEEPELVLPDIRTRLPYEVLPIKVIKPLQIDLAEFKEKQILPEVNLQANYTQFFRESLGSLGDVLKNTRTVAAADPGAAKAATNDKYLGQMLRNIEGQQEQIKGLREVADDDRLPATTRNKAKEQVKQMEEQLAVSVGKTVDYFAVAAPETVRFEADKAAVYQTVGAAINQVTDKDASARLQDDLQKTNAAAGQLASGSSALVIGQVITNAGFRVG